MVLFLSMSKHIDALILINHSNRLVEDVPRYVHEDAAQGIGYVYDDKKFWYDGTPITETARTNLYASEVFLKLGRLTASIYQNKPISFIDNTNSSKFTTIDSIKEVSPFNEGETLRLPVELGNQFSGYTESGLPLIFEKALYQDSSMYTELTAKWAMSREIHRKRGKLTIPRYNVDELVEGFGGLRMDEIAPIDITGASYDVGDLIDHAHIETHLVDSPYYSTLREQENAAELLESALQDLREVSRVIRG